MVGRKEGSAYLPFRFNGGSPPRLYRKAHDVAIDFHDRSYYGKAPQEEALWVCGKAKDGTTRFYRVATAYVVRNGLRLTLAMCFVLPQADTVAVLDELLNRLKALNLPISCLLLDKGFAGIETSYRLSGQVRGWTTSRNAAYRFVLWGLKFLYGQRMGASVLALYTSAASRGALA